MGTEIIGDAEEGKVIPSSHHNNLKKAISSDIVPRDTGGTPTNEGASLGQSALRWLKLWVKDISARLLDVVSASDSSLFTQVNPNEIILSFSSNRKVKIEAQDNGTETDFILSFFNGTSYTEGLKVNSLGIDFHDLVKQYYTYVTMGVQATNISNSGFIATSVITKTHRGGNYRFKVTRDQSTSSNHLSYYSSYPSEFIIQYRQQGTSTYQDLKSFPLNYNSASDEIGSIFYRYNGGALTIGTIYEWRAIIKDTTNGTNTAIVDEPFSFVMEETY